MDELILTSHFDGLSLGVTMMIPEVPLGIIQIVHGMSEHRKRYYDLMEFFYQQGYISIIHDHRGHGESIKEKDDLGYFYEKGNDSIIEDTHQITTFIRTRYPHLPLYLLGHSMGSLIARSYAKRYDYELSGLILSGSPSFISGTNVLLRYIRMIQKSKGIRHRSSVIQKMTFGNYNAKFKKEEGPLAWLCSDPAVIEQYTQDPMCGFVFTLDGFSTLFYLINDTYSYHNWKVNHPDLPVLFIGGEDDPCIAGREQFLKAVSHMQKVGYHNLTAKLYPKCRHEILNETIKKDVYQDILRFIG